MRNLAELPARLASLRRSGLMLSFTGCGSRASVQPNARHLIPDPARTNTSVDTVRRVHREDAVTHIDDSAEHRVRGIGRPLEDGGVHGEGHELVREEPELPTQELLRRAKETGCAGNETAF